MSTTKPFIGRREAIGLGVEATPGTGVAAQTWLRWLDQDIQPKTNVVENESAMGVVDRVNDSEITNKWAEGTIGGKVTVESVGFLMLGMFGEVVSTSPDGDGIATHTFSVKQSSEPTALSIIRVSPLKSERFSYGTVESFELEAETGGYVTVSSAIKARVGETVTDTVALVEEAEFTSKHITIKTAANVAGLAGAPVIKARSLKLNAERPSTPFDPLGTDDQPEFDLGAFEAKGEFVVRATSTEYEEAYLANTRFALQVSMVNENESLTFTASKVRFRELESSRDRDDIVTATIQYFCEFDTSTNSSVVPVLKNKRASYAAA